MPRPAQGALVRRRGPGKSSSARTEPYPQHTHDMPTCPKHGKPGIPIESSDEEKENEAPSKGTSSTSKSVSKKKTPSKEPDRSNLPASYLDIPLEEIAGEVPVYENAAVIRRKLNKLIASKAKIPGSEKTWNQTSLSKELQTLAQKSNPVKTYQGVGNHGPSVPALSRFLKKSGGMGGGDSEAYYFGNMLLEKLRIWNGEKKTKAREKAEEDYPDGRERFDPEHGFYTCMVGEPRPRYSDLANMGRSLED